MRSARRALVATALGLAILALPVAASPRSGSVTVDAEAAATEGRAYLTVISSVPGASLYMNLQYMGSLPYGRVELEPGSYLLTVGAPGYRDLEHLIVLAERTSYSLYFKLEAIQGRLDLAVEPPDAELRIDARRVVSGSMELPVGPHLVTARRFGYEEASARVIILEGSPARLELRLESAPFAVHGLEASRAAFNPANAGAFGRTTISFLATNRGSARLEIRDAAGELVAQRDFPSLETWRQAFVWNGRGSGGAVLPDGEYSVLLRATPAPGLPHPPKEPAASRDGSLSSGVSLSIDSALVARASGSIAAMPGALLFPDPRPLPAGGLAAELAWLASAADASRSAFVLGSSVLLGKPGAPALRSAVLGFGAAAETLGDPEADLALSLLLPLAGAAAPAAGTGAALGLAAFARGSWSSSASPVLPGSLPGVELSVPLSATFGPLGLGLSPGVLLDLSSSEPRLRPLARAGAWGSGPRWRAGFSAALELGGSGGAFSPSWPALVGAEARLVLSPSLLTAAIHALGAFEPGSAPELTIGLGLGFLL